jgi:hypothetical protein
VAFVERYTGRSLSGAPSAAVKTYATTDIALKQHVAITNTFQYTYGGQQLVNENYYITGVYSYEQDADYYMVEQEVIMMNGDLKIVHEEETSISGVTGLKYGIASYGFSKGMKTYCTLVPEVKNNNIVQLTQASPLTSTGSASFTTGSSYNIGGNVGLTTSGPTANISGGITISSSYTTSIPDVSVTNKCISGDVEGIKDDNGFVEWIYDIAWPTSQMDYWDTGHHRWQIDDEPAIARNTAFYYNSWIWIIKHPTGRYGMVKRVYGYTGYTLGALNMWGYYYTKTSYSYRWYSRQIMFNQPTRVWNK